MKNFRLAKGVKEQYNSIEELCAAWGTKSRGKKRTKDVAKLQAQRDNFRSYHKCKACGQPMEYVGAGAMACKNPSCKGIKVERTGKDGNVITTYEVSYEMLESKYAEIAENIFD